MNPGTYNAVVKEIGVGESKNKLAQVAIKFGPYEIEGDDGFETIESESITGFFMLQYKDRAVNQKTIDNLREVFPEWDGKDVFWLEDHQYEEIDGSTLVGKEVQIVVDAEEYEGKTRTRVKYLNPKGSQHGGIKKADPDTRRRISAALGAAIRATAKPSARPVLKPAAPRPTSDSDTVWAAFTQAWPENKAGAEDTWHEMIGEVIGDNGDESKISAQQWAEILALVPKYATFS